jgi:hypothetical protein
MLPFLLASVTCVGGGRSSCAGKKFVVAEPAWTDPLERTESNDDASGDKGARIAVKLATLGKTCGVEPGNATESLAKQCDGKRRCDYALDDTIIPTQWHGNAG